MLIGKKRKYDLNYINKLYDVEVINNGRHFKKKKVELIIQSFKRRDDRSFRFL